MYGGECEFCGRKVETAVAAYPVTGWEITRAQGGANRIAGRERVPNRIAHGSCVEEMLSRRKRGISEEQEALL